MAQPLTLILVEGHDALRSALAARLAGMPNICLLAAVGDIPAALAAIAAERPDLVLFEPKTMRQAAATALPALLATGCPVIVWTSSLVEGEEAMLLRYGAHAVLLKEPSLEPLMVELKRVNASS